MFIAQPPSGRVKLRRSGMTWLQSGSARLPAPLHAAPTELEDTFVRLPCYKHGAPNGASPSGLRALEDPCKEQPEGLTYKNTANQSLLTSAPTECRTRRWLRHEGLVLGYAIYEDRFVVDAVELVGDGSPDGNLDGAGGKLGQVERGTGSWRTYHYVKRNGNLYPCHGLGPVAQYMSLGAHRGHASATLVSFSSPSRVRALYAKANFPADHKWNKEKFIAGDINTSIIKTALGRTIMVQWDEQSPRPYSRHNLIQGTKGTLAGFPNRFAIEGVNSYPRVDRGRGVGEVRRAVRAPALQARRRARQEDGRPRRHGLPRCSTA